MKNRFCLAITILLMLFTGISNGAMLDPSVDVPGEQWCYLAKSTTVIGIPKQTGITQITFDGAVFTRNAELCFFYDPDRKPLLARGKTFVDGWMPIVQYAWVSGDVAYDIEYFAFALDGENADNSVNFVRVRMRNTGNRTTRGLFTAALRHSGGDYRFGTTKFDPTWKYEINDGQVWRDHRLTYVFSTDHVTVEAIPGTAYEASFAGSDDLISPRAECCLATYQQDLKPSETLEMTFKMPRVPVRAGDDQYLNKLANATYSDYRRKTVDYWKNLMAGKASFEFPEKRVQEAQRASTVHVMLATRSVKDGWQQTDGLPYENFFLTSMPQMVLSYLTAGRSDWAKDVVLRGISYQQPNGLYQDRALAHGKEIPAAHGHVMYAASLTVLYSRDRELGNEIYPSLKKSVDYLVNSIDHDPYGLLPPAYPYDNEMILGHYTSNNTWALLGIRNLVRLATFLGHDDDAASWTKVADRLNVNILKAVNASAKPDGYVPPGLYPYASGPAARKGFAFYQTDSDWENMLLAFPTELLRPNDPRVRGTVDHIRQGYAEGIMTYRHGQHLHQYITANQVEQYLVMGDDYTALKDFYHILLHTGSTSEGFENLVIPWTDREVSASCPTPHAWASAKLACLIRDLVLLEYGGQCGMDFGQRELWMFHCLSPAWVKTGEKVAFENAPTEFGTISAAMTFKADGADISIHSQFHDAPKALRIRMPYFKELISFTSNASRSVGEGDCILLSPDATTLSINWRDKPGANLHTVENILTDYRSANSFGGVDARGYAIINHHQPFLLDGEKTDVPQPLGFDLVRNTFLLEYNRRAAESVKSGTALLKIKAPPMLSAKERETLYIHMR